MLGRYTVADAAAAVLPAVVNITLAPQRGGWFVSGTMGTSGSGFIVSASGEVVTNAHVIRYAAEHGGGGGIMVTLADGSTYPAHVVAMDLLADIALLQIDLPAGNAKPLPTVKLGDSSSARVGEWVLALGCPLTLQNSVTVGIISSPARDGLDLGLSGRMQYIQVRAGASWQCAGLG